MKQLGNLAVICARRSGVLLQILDGGVTIHIGTGPGRQSYTSDWDDDEQINELIHEFNFGKLSERVINNEPHN